MPYLLAILLLASVETEIERLKDPSANARLAACSALKKMGPAAKAAVPALIDTLDDRNGLVRRGAIMALGAIGDTRAIDALVQRLDTLDDRTRGLAANSLRRIGKPAVPAVLAKLADGKPHARAAAAAALPNGEGTEELNAALKDDAPEVRVAAAGALVLADRTHAAAGAVLRNAMSSGSRIADPAIQAVEVAQVFDAATITALARVLSVQDQTLRWRAARALGRAGKAAKPATPALTGAMRTSSYYVRTAVAYALGRIGDPAPVLALLRDPNLDVVLEVAHAFKSMPREPLFELLGSDKAYVLARTARACTALSKGGSPAVPALRKLLNHEDLTVRCDVGRAVWVLSGDAEAALPALTAALEAEGPAVRKRAAKTLGLLARRALDAVPALEKLAHDPDKEVAKAAQDALKRIGSR